MQFCQTTAGNETEKMKMNKNECAAVSVYFAAEHWTHKHKNSHFVHWSKHNGLPAEFMAQWKRLEKEMYL